MRSTAVTVIVLIASWLTPEVKADGISKEMLNLGDQLFLTGYGEKLGDPVPGSGLIVRR